MGAAIMLNRSNILPTLLLLSLAACSPAGTSSSSNSNGGGAGGNNPTGGNGSGPAADGAKFFLPTGQQVDNTAAPSVEVDAQGNVHSIYPAFAKGGAYYAYCGAGCSGPDTTQVVKFETDGTVTNAMIALDSAGHPRVLLNGFHKVYYGMCDANCGDSGSWTINPILDHNGDLEISGEALALDPAGHPRFLMHTYRTYLGFGQKDPTTVWASCDANCTDPSGWTQETMGAELWQGSTLRFDAQGTAHVVTANAIAATNNVNTGIYYECSADCGKVESWTGYGFGPVFESVQDIVEIKATVTMALTKNGTPRVAMIARDDSGSRRIIFGQCDSDCVHDNWQFTALNNDSKIDAGLDLALDANDKPRLVFTQDYNIGMYHCDDAQCGGMNSNWGMTKVELGSDLPADQIFLNTNCTVGAWFFHTPSIAITSDGKARVGYQARDLSGGFGHPDTPNSDCVAGTDMTWSRIALLASDQ